MALGVFDVLHGLAQQGVITELNLRGICYEAGKHPSKSDAGSSEEAKVFRVLKSFLETDVPQGSSFRATLNCLSALLDAYQVRPELVEKVFFRCTGRKPKNCAEASIQRSISSLNNEANVLVVGDKGDTWHEIVFDSRPYNKRQVHCQWKIHLAPSTNTPMVLEAIKPVLLKRRPYCKIVQSDRKLADLAQSKDVNGSQVFKGKFLTIYPKTNEEALLLARELNEALQRALLDPNDAIAPCTDRPLGNSGYLWARNDLAGGPLDEVSYKDANHAHALPGNYDTTIILPMKAYDFEQDEKGRRQYQEWYSRNYPSFKRVKHTDIFKTAFGSVKWLGAPDSDKGKFVNR